MHRDPRQVLTELLVLEARTGRDDAFRDLHELWRADLHRLALSRVEQPALADEVASDAWLAIARGLHRLDDPACFPRWAFRIVERRAADCIRRRQLDRRRETSASLEIDTLAPAPTPSPTYEPPDDIFALRSAIARLPPDERHLVELHYAHGRSTAEIAEILAIPPGTVKSRLFSIRQHLKQRIEKNRHE